MDSPPHTRVRSTPQAAGVAMLLLGGCFRRLFGRLLDAVLAIKPLDAPCGIDQALRPSVKRMTLRANLDVQLLERRARFEGVAARTDYDTATVIRMDSSFHFYVSNSFHCCLRGYHPMVSHTISPPRPPFRAVRLAIAAATAFILITLCPIATFAASGA